MSGNSTQSRPADGASLSAALLFALVVTLIYAYAAAADAASATVRTRLEPSSASIGQPATLYVDVFTEEFFTSGVELPALSVPGAVIKLSDDRPQHISTTVRGASWVGIEHKYSITPIVAADLIIPAFEVAAHVGAQSTLATAKTRAVTLQVAIPAGAENAFITHDLRITQKIDADLGSLKVGDAFTRSVELRATGTPAMFIPDITFADVPGLKAYVQTPMLTDSAPDARLTGRRTFAVNYVVQQPGDYHLPSVAVRWWDLDTKKIQSAEAPALDVHAVAAPAAPPAFSVPVDQAPAPAVKTIPWRRLGIDAAAVLVTVTLLWWLAPPALRLARRFANHRRLRHEQYLASEPHAFAQLRSTLRRGDAERIPAALYHWLDRLPQKGARIEPVLGATRDQALLSAAASLWNDLYGREGAPSSGTIRQLRRTLTPARRALFAAHGSSPAAIAALPPMNPD